jgi:hypothetical protein
MKVAALEDHMCRECGGRIARMKDHGPTPGGNPVYMCVNCGASTSAMGPDYLCWCGFAHRGQHITAYRCLPFTILVDRPELLEAFRSCGCEPGRQLIGVVLESALRKKT